MSDKTLKTDDNRGTEAAETHESELLSPIWAVIGFDRCFGYGLSYEEAAALVARLAIEKHVGLCVVTDETAARMKRPPVQ
ncbi:MAG: DUF4260 domain-containing protein [Acidobacteriota bacterium]|nr:DUF4260 domain-containing protein [Acidobacteriota bacterium]